MLRTKLFPRGGRTWQEIEDDINGFFLGAGVDVPEGGLDVREDVIVAVYDDGTEDPEAERKKLISVQRGALNALLSQRLAKELIYRHDVLLAEKKLGGSGKREARQIEVSADSDAMKSLDEQIVIARAMLVDLQEGKLTL